MNEEDSSEKMEFSMLHLDSFGENKSLGGSLRGLLESMGFVITDDGKHYKWIYFGDHRYSATMAKTSSDNRAGMNMASLIDNLML